MCLHAFLPPLISLVSPSVVRRLCVQAQLGNRWSEISTRFPGRTASQCAHRWRRTCDVCVRPKTWSSAEDATLHAAVAELGSCWGPVASRLPGRTAHQCRARWSAIRGTSRKRGKGHRSGAKAPKDAALGAAPRAPKGEPGPTGSGPDRSVSWDTHAANAGAETPGFSPEARGAEPLAGAQSFHGSLPTSAPARPDAESSRHKASHSGFSPSANGLPGDVLPLAPRDLSPPGLPTPSDEGGRGPPLGARRDSDLQGRSGARGGAAPGGDAFEQAAPGSVSYDRSCVDSHRPLTLGETLAGSGEAAGVSGSQALVERRRNVSASLDRLFQQEAHANTAISRSGAGSLSGDLTTPPREDKDDRAVDASANATPPNEGGARGSDEGTIGPARAAAGKGQARVQPLNGCVSGFDAAARVSRASAAAACGAAAPAPAPASALATSFPAPAAAPSSSSFSASQTVSVSSLRTPVADRCRPSQGLLSLTSPRSPDALLMDGRLLASAGSPACILVDAQSRRAALLPRDTPSPLRARTVGISAPGISSRNAWTPRAHHPSAASAASATSAAIDAAALGPVGRRVAGAEPHGLRSGLASPLAYSKVAPYSILGASSGAATVAAAGASSAAASAAAAGDIGPELAAAWGGGVSAPTSASWASGLARAELDSSAASLGGDSQAPASHASGSLRSIPGLGAPSQGVHAPSGQGSRVQTHLHPKGTGLSRAPGLAPPAAVKTASRLGATSVSATAQGAEEMDWLAQDAMTSPEVQAVCRDTFACRLLQPEASDSPRTGSTSTPPRVRAPPPDDSTPPRLRQASTGGPSPSRRCGSLSPRWGGPGSSWTPSRLPFESMQPTPPRKPRALTPALLEASVRGSPAGSPLLRFSGTPPRPPFPDDGLSPFLALGDGLLSPDRGAPSGGRGDPSALGAASPLSSMFRSLDSPLLPRPRGSGGIQTGCIIGAASTLTPIAPPLDLSDRACADVDDVEAALRRRGRTSDRDERGDGDGDDAALPRDFFSYSPRYASRSPLGPSYAPYMDAGLFAGDDGESEPRARFGNGPASDGREARLGGEGGAEYARSREAFAGLDAERSQRHAAGREFGDRNAPAQEGSVPCAPRPAGHVHGLSPRAASRTPPRTHGMGVQDAWAWEEGLDETQGGSPLLSAKWAAPAIHDPTCGRATGPWSERKRCREALTTCAFDASGSPPSRAGSAAAYPPHLPTPPSNSRRTHTSACTSHLLQFDGDASPPEIGKPDDGTRGRKRAARGSAAVRNTLKALLGCQEGGSRQVW